MKSAFVALAAISVLAAGNAAASEKLAQTSGCMTCHAIDKKLIGPSYKVSPPNTATTRVPKPIS